MTPKQMLDKHYKAQTDKFPGTLLNEHTIYVAMEEYAKAYAQSSQQQGDVWQPIETAPKDIKIVVGHPSYDTFPVAQLMLVDGVDENDNSVAWSMWVSEDEKQWEEGTLWPDLGYIEPTHWMPLPGTATPTASGNGEGELVQAYKDYVQLLVDEISDLCGVAAVHGWKSQRVKQGEAMREKIAMLSATPPTEQMPEVEMCKCGKNPATKELHSCPYQTDVNDDDSDYCNCCDDCCHECAMGI